MHDARRMRGLQRVEHAEHQARRLARRQRAIALQLLGQRRPRDVFEDEIRLALLLVGLVHRHDVRMVQPAHAACLMQPLAHRRDVGTRAQQLDRYFAIQARVIDAARGTAALAARRRQRAHWCTLPLRGVPPRGTSRPKGPQGPLRGPGSGRGTALMRLSPARSPHRPRATRCASCRGSHCANPPA